VEVELALTAHTDPLVMRSTGSATPPRLLRLADPQDALMLVRRVLDRVNTIEVGPDGP
jgi:hypothetical protein